MEFVADRRALVIMDNCEHLLADAADVAQRLVGSCPSLSVSANSRESLSIPTSTPTVSVPWASAVHRRSRLVARPRRPGPLASDRRRSAPYRGVSVAAITEAAARWIAGT